MEIFDVSDAAILRYLEIYYRPSTILDAQLFLQSHDYLVLIFTWVNVSSVCWLCTNRNKTWECLQFRRHLKRTYLLTHLITSLSRVLLEKLTGFQPVKKYPSFYGTRRFITAFTSAHQLSLSWTSSIHSTTPHSTSWRSILISFSHLSLGLPSGLFPSDFPTKTLYTPPLSPIRDTCPAHLFLLDFITRIILREEYRSLTLYLLTCRIWWIPNSSSKGQMRFNLAFKGLSSSLCSLLHSLVASSHLAPNIFLSILFSNTLSLRSSLHVSDQFQTSQT